MKPHLKYDYKVVNDSAPDEVIKMVGSKKLVLELGCGPGSIARHLKANNCAVTGVELDEAAISVARQHCENVLKLDLNDLDWHEKLPEINRFDTIVAADVLEHLVNPWETLAKVGQLMNPEGCLVVSLPHAGHASVIACFLSSDVAYHSWGLLDKTHIRFFGLKNIQELLEGAGFKILEAKFVVVRPERTELANIWDSLPKTQQDAILESQTSQIYQVVLKAIPINGPGNGINLLNLPVGTTRNLSSWERISHDTHVVALKGHLPNWARNYVGVVMNTLKRVTKRR